MKTFSRRRSRCIRGAAVRVQWQRFVGCGVCGPILLWFDGDGRWHRFRRRDDDQVLGRGSLRRDQRDRRRRMSRGGAPMEPRGFVEPIQHRSVGPFQCVYDVAEGDGPPPAVLGKNCRAPHHLFHKNSQDIPCGFVNRSTDAFHSTAARQTFQAAPRNVGTHSVGTMTPGKCHGHGMQATKTDGRCVLLFSMHGSGPLRRVRWVRF